MHLGSEGGDALAVAAVTGSEAEASALLDEALSAHPGRPNLIEDHLLHTSPAGAGGIGLGEHRPVHVVLSGPDDDVQVHDVYLGESEARARREELRHRGIDDARVVTAVTNQWI